MKAICLTLVSLALLTMACESEDLASDPAVIIELTNATDTVYSEVYTPDLAVNFGSLAPGETASYAYPAATLFGWGEPMPMALTAITSTGDTLWFNSGWFCGTGYYEAQAEPGTYPYQLLTETIKGRSGYQIIRPL